jgi:hypothetical protein
MSTDILGRESLVSRPQGSLPEQAQTAAKKSAKAGATSGLHALFVPMSPEKLFRDSEGMSVERLYAVWE